VSRRLLTLALLGSACVGGCADGRLGEQLGQDAAWEPVTVLALPSCAVESPYDAGLTESWAAVVDAEVRRVASLFALPLDGSLRVRLVPVPVPAQAGDEPWRLLMHGVDKRGLAGYAPHGADFVVVYVPDDRSLPDDRILEFLLGGPVATSSVVRHELAHALSQRAGLPADPRWFQEGLAECVEHMDEDSDRLVWPAITPIEVVRQADPAPGALRALLDWPELTTGSGPEDLRPELYDSAHALFRFLAGPHVEAGFAEAARRAAALDRGQLLELEGAWVSWLGALDPLAEVAAGLAAPEADTRDRARWVLNGFSLLWKERGQMRAAVTLALDSIRRDGITSPTATMLALFGPQLLSGDEVLALEAQGDSGVVLAQALRQARGEALDVERLLRAWAALPAPRRIELSMPEYLLGELLKPTDSPP